MKSVKIKAAVYFVVFIAAAVLTYIFTIGKSVYNTDTSSMTAAGLPVIYMTSDSGIKYNYLHGYAGEVNQKQLHDAITPIDDTRELTVSIKQYQSVVSGVSYEISTQDQETLVERNSVSDYTGRDGIVTVNLRFKNLMEADREYLLKITLNTENYGEVSYFTRIVKLDTSNLDRKLQYVMDFSENTRREETLGNVTAKLEPDSTEDNTNLGRVNIHSKLSQVGFAGLQPQLLSERFFTITEIDADRASVTVTYKAETSDESGRFQYNIKEFYRIYQPDSTVTYVYNFDRWMNQIFNPSKGISGRGEIYLGIRSDADIDVKASNNGKISTFVLDGNLWSFSVPKNSFTKVFSFEDEDSDGIREDYQAHKIKVLNLEDNGNMDFLVYGYMNRGIHEGEMGISVYRYDAGKHTTEEVIFIPRKDSFEVIANDIAKLAYMNANGILYIYSNQEVFYLDCATREYMVVAGDIQEGISSMCEENSLFVFQTGNDPDRCSELNVLHLDTGEIYVVSADMKESIKMLGYIDGNIVYGKMYDDMLTVTRDGKVISPMYCITIMNKDNEIIREYKEEGYFVTEALLSNSQIIFERVRYNDEGEMVEAASDSLLSNIEDSSAKMQIITRATEFRQKEQYISLIAPGSSNANLSEPKYIFADNTSVLISAINGRSEEYYYAYGFGELYKICYSLSDAMQAAYESGGVVVDSNGETVWNRYKPQSHHIVMPEGALDTDKTSLTAATDVLLKTAGSNTESQTLYEQGYSTLQCIEKEVGRAEDLSGCEIDLALYFVGAGHPIIAKTGEERYELVKGYDKNNVYTLDFETKTEKTYLKNDFDTVISDFDSILITY